MEAQSLPADGQGLRGERGNRRDLSTGNTRSKYSCSSRASRFNGVSGAARCVLLLHISYIATWADYEIANELYGSEGNKGNITLCFPSNLESLTSKQAHIEQGI